MRLKVTFGLLIMCGLVIGRITHDSCYSDCNSRISISGKTNINRFQLHQVISDQRIMDFTENFSQGSERGDLMKISIPVRDFIANNRFVYNDFLELINVSENPDIIIILDENQIRRMNDGEMSNALVGIELNGITKYYSITCKICRCLNGKLLVEGVRVLKLTDFKLAPKEKSYGIIKVKNELIVNFELSLPAGSKLIYSQN